MVRNIAIGDLTIDCADAYRAREFYSELTGWEKTIAFDCLALKAYNGMMLLFAETDDISYNPPVWPEEQGKQQKQMHFNFQVDDLTSAVEEAICLGASKSAAQFGGDHFVTMLDTEGHPFCLCKK
ncbi:MAG: VOC family protein [Lachnospiraceae bacterium]